MEVNVHLYARRAAVMFNLRMVGQTTIQYNGNNTITIQENYSRAQNG